MTRLALLKHSAVAVAVALGLVACGDRDGTGAQRTPDPAPAPPTGAPPANTAAPPTSAPPPALPQASPTVTDPAGSATVAAAVAAAKVAAADRDFLTLAASSGLMEVEASRLALDRAKNEQVRAFAQRMIDDHTRANENLQAVAKSAGMNELPLTMTAAHSAHVEKLRALNGQAFEREYAAQVGVAGHTEAVAVFERVTRDGAHQEVRLFAEKTLPALREHLQQSQNVAKAVGVPADRMKAASAPPALSSVGATGTPGKPAATDGGTSGTAAGTNPTKSTTGK